MMSIVDPKTNQICVLFEDNVARIYTLQGPVDSKLSLPEHGGIKCKTCGKFRDDVLFWDEREHRFESSCDHCRQKESD